MKRTLLFLLLLSAVTNLRADAFPDDCSECCGTPDLSRCRFMVLNSAKASDFNFFIQLGSDTFALEDSTLYHATNRKVAYIWAVHKASGAKSRRCFFDKSDPKQTLFISDVKLINGLYEIQYSREPFRRELIKGRHRGANKAGLDWIPYAAISVFSLLLLLLRKRFRLRTS